MKKIRTLSLIIVFLIMTLGMSCSKGGSYLVIEDQNSGKVYSKIKFENSNEFSIGFIHSVNKSPLKETYRVENKKIYPVSITFSAFGAGMQTDLEEGQILSYTDSGEMIITGFTSSFDELNYIVGTVYDHILFINDEEIILAEISHRNAPLRFYIR